MALYIDSAFLSDILPVLQTIPVAGITINPSSILAAQERGQKLDMLSLIRELQRMVEGFITRPYHCTTSFAG